MKKPDPHAVLGVSLCASIDVARARHASLCHGLVAHPQAAQRKARYDAALAWIVEHWMDMPAELPPSPRAPRRVRQAGTQQDSSAPKAQGVGLRERGGVDGATSYQAALGVMGGQSGGRVGLVL